MALFAQFRFQFWAFYYRHKIAAQFFFLNVGIQIIPVVITAINTVRDTHDFSWNRLAEAFWVMFAFALWNVPSFIRQHLRNPSLTYRWRVSFYAFAAIITFIIFWELSVRHTLLPSQALPIDDLQLAFIPLLLTLLISIIVGVINYSLLVETRLRLIWSHQAQFAGIYMAYYLGRFTEAGLRIEIEPAEPTKDNPALDRFGGYNSFAIVSSTDIPKARDRGVKMRAISVIVPEKTVVFLAPEQSGIECVADFQGKKVAFREGYEEADLLKIMLKKNGLTIRDVEAVPIGQDWGALFDGFADIVAGYEAMEPIQYAQAGMFVRTFAAEWEGHPLFGDTLVTNEEIIRAQPEVVRAVVNAVETGWLDAAIDPSSSVSATLFFMRDYREDDTKLQRASLNCMLGLRCAQRSTGTSVSLIPFGMADEDWKPILSAMEDANLIAKGQKAVDMYWR
jgi:ABC-type nitrate/sulfonate/bicarbonate transport system substrate-binding protein